MSYKESTADKFSKRQEVFAERENRYAGEEPLGNFHRVAFVLSLLWGLPITPSHVAHFHIVDKMDREWSQRRQGDPPDDPIRLDSRNDHLCYSEIYDFLVGGE